MQRFVLKQAAALTLALIVVLGCDPSLQQLGGGNSFTDAPTTTDGTTGGGAGGTTGPGGTTGGLVVTDGSGNGEDTQSFFTAFQIDPREEDSAGPKFVTAADIDQDGLLDLVTAWNESQPIQLHLQRRDANDNISFRTINLGGTTPLALTAGLEVGQINGDGWLDVVVLVKSTGSATFCPTVPPTEIGLMDGEIVVLFSPGNAIGVEDGDRWTQMIITESNRFPGFDAGTFYQAAARPEIGGFTSLAVGEVDGLPGDDIITAFNAAECEELGQFPPINTVELYANPGGAASEDGTAWMPVTLDSNLPQVKDIELVDIDGDGDLDVVSTWTNLVTRNVHWVRNPLIPNGTASVMTGTAGWQLRPIGQIATGADILAIGDIDSDGFDDVVVRSSIGQIVQWFRRPVDTSVQPIFPPPDVTPTRFNFPWPVFTLAVFSSQEPEAISVGDITGDGQVEVIIAAEGAVFWYDGTVGDSVFGEWAGNTVIRDNPPDETDPNASSSGESGLTQVDTSTIINTLLIVDLDGDGRNDIIGTLDRRSGSGLNNDRLVWYRNIRSE